jgi:shikimate kinase
VTVHKPRPAAVLIGLRGSGKTTLGRLLAARRSVPFVDLDDRTVSSSGHPTISAMFRAMGEPAFRVAERIALEHALAHDASTGAVIALGGGTPTAPGARELIERARTEGRIRVVLLEAPPAVLGSRLSLAPGDRPLLVGANFAEEAAMLAERRMPLYRTLADATVSTAAGTADALAAVERALDG